MSLILSMMAPGLEEIYERDSRCLIECITNLKEGDEPFDQCIDYVISNFCYSRFLDVNRHSVLRSVDGLCRKFLIHSQEKKAEVLESHCRKFIQSEVFKELNIVNTDVQYSLLCLLILLADNPTANNGGYVSIQRIDESEAAYVEDEMDDFRWRSYLLEDEPRDEVSLSPSSNLSVWSDCDDDKFVGGYEVADDQEEDSTPTLGVLCCETVSRSCEKSDSGLRNELSGRGWLCRHIQSPYWVGISLDSASSGSRSLSRNRTSNLRSEWEDFIQQSNILRLTSSVPLELTERKILREALWMLGGRGQLFVFDCIHGMFVVREGVVLSHLTEKCLRQLLTPLTSCSVTLLKLRRFVDEFVDFTPRSSPGANRFFCRTYEAYAFTLSSLLLDFDRVVCNLERIVIEQYETFTLTMLLERLEPWIEDFEVLARIHETVLDREMESSITLCERVSCLLQQLFLAVVNHSGRGIESSSFLLKLFLKTVRPYLEIIDSWVTFGRLRDKHGEFPIARNEEVSMFDEKFWDSAVLVKCVCPSFMEPMLDLLLVTGKSMELLRCLGKLPEVTRCGSRSSLKPLYDAFVQLVECELSDTRVEESRDRTVDALNPEKTFGPVWKSILARNFDDYLVTSDVTSRNDDVKRLPGVRFGCSPRLLLCCCFSKEVSVRCRQTCSMLMAILNEEHCLNDDLVSIRRFWLMEAGDVLFHFYSQVFEKISRDVIWSEEMNLGIILDDVLLTFSPRDVSRITVRLDESAVNGSCVRPINCYDGIRLYYRNRWPLGLVVGRSMWAVYDSIFTFLLQVKWAKYALDELRFTDLEGRDDVTISLKEIHVTRMKLLHFMNSFHDWLMTSLCGGTNDRTPWNEASNLQDIMDEHTRYLELVRERCLLNPNTKVVHDAICNVLNVAVIFHDLWKGIDPKRTFNNLRFLRDVEKELSGCRRFLFGLLRNTSWTSSQRFLIHVESLVSALGGSSFDVTNSDSYS